MSPAPVDELNKSAPCLNVDPTNQRIVTFAALSPLSLFFLVSLFRRDTQCLSVDVPQFMKVTKAPLTRIGSQGKTLLCLWNFSILIAQHGLRHQENHSNSRKERLSIG